MTTIVFGPRLAFSAEVIKKQSVTLVQVGSSFTSDDGGKLTPIWAIMIGNTNKAEQSTRNWSQNFGPYAIDGTMWVHPADNPLEIWERKIFHRPKNIFESLVFYENPEIWKFTEKDNYRVILPLPWRKLTLDQLAKVEFIVTYFTGDTKIYLKSEISTEEAKELFEWVLTSN